MSRYFEVAHQSFVPAPVVIMSSSSSAAPGGPIGVTKDAEEGSTFVVKLRDIGTRMWGNQTEVVATSAQAAAEAVAGEQLHAAVGERANLRARVWLTPFGAHPDVAFYVSTH